MHYFSTAAERRETLRLAIVIAPFALVAIIAIGVMVSSFTRPLRIPAPFTYSAAVYQPVEGEVCPGDNLSWNVSLIVRRAPVMIVSARSIWSVDRQETAVSASSAPSPATGSSVSFAVWTSPLTINRITTMQIPNITPGRYEVRAAAQEFRSDASAYTVPFRVKEGCK